ncbi:MAG TPA: AAA family ATPase [Dehalococcoidia bacterium]|nr:AAA family ATPase [Dehalococcoidia bacterium]
MPRTRTSSPLVGRTQELTILDEALSAAAAAAGGVALVAGEPGIGKSRLLAELAVRAEHSGWSVLQGRAYEADGLPPYLPFIEAIGGYARQGSPQELQRFLTGEARHVALLMPELRRWLLEPPVPPGVEPDRFRLFEGVCEFLVAIANHGSAGMLLLLDDLHWADTASVLLLQHLARWVQQQRVLVVGAYRSITLSNSPAFVDALAELRREHLALRVHLGALTEDATDNLIGSLSPVRPSVAVRQAIIAETQGNPFYVEEMVRHLTEQGFDLTHQRPNLEAWGVPDGVREVVGRRLGRLRPDTYRVLQAAAILGDTATHTMLLAMDVGDWTDLTVALEEAVAAGVLYEDGEAYRFTHVLIRQTLLTSLSIPRRQHLHMRAAEGLERLYAHDLASYAAVLAGHYRQAGAAGNVGKTLHYARAAAAAARAVFAWEEAAHHWAAALEAVAAGAALPPRDHCELLLALGDAQFHAGEFPAWRDTYVRAAQAAHVGGTAEQLARAAVAYAEFSTLGVLDNTALSQLDAALAALGEDDSAPRARTLGLMAEVLVFGNSDLEGRALALSAEALAIARRLGDPETLAVALNERLWALRGGPDSRETLALTDEFETLAPQLADRGALFKARRWRIEWLLMHGELTALTAALETFEREVVAYRHPLYLTWVKIYQGLLMTRLGRLDAFVQLNEESESLAGRTSDVWAGSIAAMRTFIVKQEQGRTGDAREVLQAAIERSPTFTALRAALALVDAETGNLAAASATIGAILTPEFSSATTGFDRPAVLFLLAQTACVLGDSRRALTIYTLLRPYAAMNCQHFYYPYDPAIARFLGMLATSLALWTDAEQHFTAALAIVARSSGPRGGAHVRRQFAEMLLARADHGDRERAHGLLQQAIATYDEIDMPYWATRTRALIGAARPAGS